MTLLLVSEFTILLTSSNSAMLLILSLLVIVVLEVVGLVVAVSNHDYDNSSDDVDIVILISIITRVSPRFVRAPAAEHISNLHSFWLNKVYYLSHAVIDLLCECGVIWVKSDGALLITNTHTHTYIYNIR